VRRAPKTPLVLVLPLGRPGSGSELDAWVGAGLARGLGRRLEATGRRVVAPEVASRVVRGLGLDIPSGPIPEAEREAIVAQTGADHVVHGTFTRGKKLALDLVIVAQDGSSETVLSAGPEATFQAVLDDAAQRLLLSIPGGPIDDSARAAMRAVHGTTSLDAFLAVVRARAAWADGDQEAFEQEVSAAQRLDPLWAEPHEVTAVAARSRGDAERAVAALREVPRIHATAGRRHEQAESLLHLGDALVRKGDWDAGTKAYEEGAALFESLHEVRGAVQARTNIANVLLRRGDHVRAIAEYQVGLERFADFPEDKAKHVFNLGLALKATGDLVGAAARFDEARELGMSLRDDALIASAYNALGAVHDDQGDSDRALQCFRRAEEYLDAESDPVLLAGVKDHIGIILKKRGQLPEALDYSEQACALFETRGEPLHLAIAYVNRAVLLLELERDDEATPFVVAAHREFVRLGSPSTETTARMLRELGLDEETIEKIPESDDPGPLVSGVADSDDELDDDSDDLEEVEDDLDGSRGATPGGHEGALELIDEEDGSDEDDEDDDLVDDEDSDDDTASGSDVDLDDEDEEDDGSASESSDDDDDDDGDGEAPEDDHRGPGF
jgi:tetratricopeptide (TPR) repeat protein